MAHCCWSTVRVLILLAGGFVFFMTGHLVFCLLVSLLGDSQILLCINGWSYFGRRRVVSFSDTFSHGGFGGVTEG